ncbi:MAG TPA: hypothetical protein VFT59_05155 [Candidatus Saccharimonadales bacterium]|nr:hypothetical protein [Candidatus Saccharimonadales bacterium]
MAIRLPEGLGYLPINAGASRLHEKMYQPIIDQSNWDEAKPNDGSAISASECNEILRSYLVVEHLDFLMSDVVPEKVAPRLEQLEGRWHPSGFMVFPLGEHPVLGFVRLHIWPKDMRHREDRGRGNLGKIWDGDIHNHAWHVNSYNIGGYRDVIYDVEGAGRGLSDEEVALNGLFRVFRVGYDKASGLDALVTEGECVRVTPREERDLFATDVHEITVGDFHAPTIPDNEFAATLAINSHRVTTHGPDILVSGDTEPIVSVRRSVTLEEKLFAKAQLLIALGKMNWRVSEPTHLSA